MFGRLAAFSDFQLLLLILLTLIVVSLAKILTLLRGIEREARISNDNLKNIARLINDDGIDNKKILSVIAARIQRGDEYP